MANQSETMLFSSKEIEREKAQLPKIKSIEKEVGKYTFNGYQKFAIVVFLICFCFGIILGNLFPACGSSSNFYGVCTTTEFNFSLMLFFWFISFLVCLFFFAIGHIISLLTSINESLRKSS